MTKTAQEVVKLWLKENGYDGLCVPAFDCGCTLDKFAPCGEMNGEECQAAYLHSDGSMYAEKENSLCPNCNGPLLECSCTFYIHSHGFLYPSKEKIITPKFVEDKSLGIPPDTNEEGF